MQQGAIYTQFLSEESPRRFAVTVEAYFRLLVEMIPQYSQRKFGREVSDYLYATDVNDSPVSSHSIYNSVTRPKPNGEYIRPNPQRVVAIVDVINKKLSEEELWPISQAMEAAGYAPTTNIRKDQLESRRARLSKHEMDKSDLYTPGYGRIGLKIYLADKIGSLGFEKSLHPRKKNLWLSTGMSIIVGKIDGLEGIQESDDDWVICGDPDAEPADNCYALIRDASNHVCAVKREHINGDDICVIAWIFGVLRFTESPRI